VQNFIVRPSEFTKEEPFIKYHIALTRQAYSLDGMQESPYAAEDAPSAADIQKNSDTINNIRLSDYRPLLETFNQIQTIRTYYDFSDVDIDRYTINDEYRQVMLSARELATEKLTDKAQTWVNLHLLYTHGYGGNGSGQRIHSRWSSALLERYSARRRCADHATEIYFGEKTSNYVFVKSARTRIRLSQGRKEHSRRHCARWRIHRLALGSSDVHTPFGDLNILLADAFTPDTRHLQSKASITHQRVAPFLMLDRDPYLVIADGKLFWIQDAYTITNHFPYMSHTMTASTIFAIRSRL
jgi:uncharacterized membrane protein (UPF0182 family)